MKSNKSLQVSQFVGGDNDARESSRVFNDGHGVDLLQPLVDHAGAADIGESRRSPVALAVTRLSPTHVQPKITKYNS